MPRYPHFEGDRVSFFTSADSTDQISSRIWRTRSTRSMLASCMQIRLAGQTASRRSRKLFDPPWIPACPVTVGRPSDDVGKQLGKFVFFKHLPHQVLRRRGDDRELVIPSQRFDVMEKFLQRIVTSSRPPSFGTIVSAASIGHTLKFG